MRSRDSSRAADEVDSIEDSFLSSALSLVYRLVDHQLKSPLAVFIMADRPWHSSDHDSRPPTRTGDVAAVGCHGL
jgi:hypothetical protein